MFVSSSVRMASRMAAPAARRAFSTASVNSSKNANAHKALMATAGLAAAVVALQEREVRINRQYCRILLSLTSRFSWNSSLRKFSLPFF